MALPISFQQEVLAFLFVMAISNLIEFILMRDYGLRARMLAVLFVDHIYVLIAWAFHIDYSLFYLYFGPQGRRRHGRLRPQFAVHIVGSRLHHCPLSVPGAEGNRGINFP
jgi:hypothetical protein